VFSWLANLFRRTDIPHRAAVVAIVETVKGEGLENPCAHIAGRIVRYWRKQGLLSARVCAGTLLPNDRRIRAGLVANRQHAVAIVALDGVMWQLDTAWTPMRWTKSRPVWQVNTEQILDADYIDNPPPGSIFG
jgi:hypothetical protein